MTASEQPKDQDSSIWIEQQSLRLLDPCRKMAACSEMIVNDPQVVANHQLCTDAKSIQTSVLSLHNFIDKSFDVENPQLPADSESARQFRHDLRSPINGVLGYSEMMLDDINQSEHPQLTEQLSRLIDHSHSFLQKIEDVMHTVELRSSKLLTGTGYGAGSADASSVRTSMNEASIQNRRALQGKILVVDDISASRDLLVRRLTREGHWVSEAADGMSALTLLRDGDFDLVLLDLIMPQLNGFEVLLKMRDDDQLRNIPVIVNSALEDSAGVAKCIEIGAFDYLPKPFNPNMLQARIQAGLESKLWTDDERREKEFIRQAFEQFVSPAVVDSLLADSGNLSLGGERAEITCLFTDLTGFTSLIEAHEPSVVLPEINRYLNGLCRIVLDNEGTIDKIVGDAINTFFGAPIKLPDHAERAVNCAIELDRYARNFAAEQIPASLGFGHTRIGVHTGIAVVGNFGGDSFFDYTAYGDVVNTTSRIESVNKHLGTTVCVTADVKQRCPQESFRPVGQLLLKGKSKPVEAFEPVARTDLSRCPVADYEKVYHLVQEEAPTAAAEIAALLVSYPSDALLRLYADRLEAGVVGTLIETGK